MTMVGNVNLVSYGHFNFPCMHKLRPLDVNCTKNVAFWFPVENREEPIKSVLCGVRVCVTDYLRNRSEDFSETRHEVGGQKCKKRSTAAFLRFWPVLAKAADFIEKKNFWPFLAVFGPLRKIRSEDFS